MNNEQARYNMIQQQIRPWGVLDKQVLEIVAKTPREQFAPAAYRTLAFADTLIPLGHGQVMLTPKEEAFILQELRIHTHDIVLEIGTGSGYMTALLAQQAKQVYSVDIFPDFIQQAQTNLHAHEITNAHLQIFDAAATGYPLHAPYHVIVITGALPQLPDCFREQLHVGGRLFAIIGQAPAMTAVLLTRHGIAEWEEKSLFETVVPPLLYTPEKQAFNF